MGKLVGPEWVERELGLTSNQAVFVLAYLKNGGNATAAAREAFQTNNPDVVGNTYLQKPKIRNAIRELALGHAVGLSYECSHILMDIARDQENPAGARVQAVTRVLELGGLLGPASRRDDAGAASDKPLSEMTVDELERAALEQRSRLESALKAVEDLRAEAHAQAGAIIIDAQPVRVPDGSGPWD